MFTTLFCSPSFCHHPVLTLCLVSSPGFLRFVRVLCGMSSDERKAFLQFTTGCSTLPPGGLANLHPRLTIVRKVCVLLLAVFFCRRGQNLTPPPHHPAGGRHGLQLPISEHVRPLPEAAWVFVWGHHEGASAGRHHGEGLPPQLTCCALSTLLRLTCPCRWGNRPTDGQTDGCRRKKFRIPIRAAVLMFPPSSWSASSSSSSSSSWAVVSAPRCRRVCVCT